MRAARMLFRTGRRWAQTWARRRRQLEYRLRGIEAINQRLLTTTHPAPILREFGAKVGHGPIHGPIVIHNAIRDYSNLRIGEGVHLGRDVILDLAGPLTIDDNATISMRAVILTHQHVSHGPLRLKYPPKTKATMIGRNSFIGAGAIVLCGNDVGENGLVAAGAVVIKPVPRGVSVAGIPARPI